MSASLIPNSPSLDHVVIDVRDRMDEAVRVYRALGFHLTPIGRHSLGTINHLAMFGSNYLELLGYEPGATNLRVDVAGYPPGLNGLVFGTADSAATFETMTARGVPIQEPVEFFRPVELDDGTHEDARFRTVRLPRDTVPGVRAYFCHHLTRQLVWRDEWLHHPNGTTSIVGLVLAARDPAATASVFETMFGAESVRRDAHGVAFVMDNATLDIVTHDALAHRFGDAAADANGRTDYLAALVLKTHSPANLSAVLGAALIEKNGHATVPAQRACNVTLEFI